MTTQVDPNLKQHPVNGRFLQNKEKHTNALSIVRKLVNTARDLHHLLKFGVVQKRSHIRSKSRLTNRTSTVGVGLIQLGQRGGYKLVLKRILPA